MSLRSPTRLAQMVEVADGVGGRDVGQEPAADLAAAPRQSGGLAPKALRGGPRGGDRGARPEPRLAPLAAEAAHRGAGIAATGIPADDVESTVAPGVEPGRVAPHQGDAAVAWSARVDEHRAHPLVRLAGEVADQREADRAPVRAAPVQRHTDPGALKLLRRPTRSPRDRGTNSRPGRSGPSGNRVAGGERVACGERGGKDSSERH